MAEILIGVAAGGAAAVLFHIAAAAVERKKDFSPARKGIFIAEPREVLLSVLLFAAVAVCSWLHYGDILQMALDFVLLTGLTVLCLSDLRFYWVPGRLLLAMAVFWLAAVAATVLFSSVEAGLAVLFRGLGGSLFSGVIFLVLYLVTRGQLGGGDVKLSFILGLYLSVSRILPALLFGSVLSCVYALVQIARKKMSWKDGMPMVPFLWLGTVITVLLS